MGATQPLSGESSFLQVFNYDKVNYDSRRSEGMCKYIKSLFSNIFVCTSKWYYTPVTNLSTFYKIKGKITLISISEHEPEK